MLSILLSRADTLARQAAARARNRLLARASPPPDVRAEPVEAGLLLTGRALRRRRLTDPRLRNFGQ